MNKVRDIAIKIKNKQKIRKSYPLIYFGEEAEGELTRKG